MKSSGIDLRVREFKRLRQILNSKVGYVFMHPRERSPKPEEHFEGSYFIGITNLSRLRFMRQELLKLSSKGGKRETLVEIIRLVQRFLQIESIRNIKVLSYITVSGYETVASVVN